MKHYDAILIDIDDTLLDFPACEKAAFFQTMRVCGVTPSDALAAAFSAINLAWWKRLERGEITRQALWIGRYRTLAAQFSLPLDAAKAAAVYPDFLSLQSIPLPGMEKALQYLSPRYALYAATNAGVAVQAQRMKNGGITPYLQGCFYSEQAGAQKPAKAFFDYCFAAVPALRPETTLMLGDSLSSDICGAKNAGIDACWFNPHHSANPARFPVAIEIH
ncbi:MAG: YjjG family noncanonical pyrimidine nucleotidase, partial [Oscillospiraceae bacterium]|nr:YjjG family noncanonical pyrimidine nucleotidase [Oscillospiraceae bacterium]